MNDSMSCLNITSEDLYDSPEMLGSYGFSSNHCAKCGAFNSEIGGMLMQCGRCKKVCYCSSKCFNDHLANHQKFCPLATKMEDYEPRRSVKIAIVESSISTSNSKKKCKKNGLKSKKSKSKDKSKEKKKKSKKSNTKQSEDAQVEASQVVADSIGVDDSQQDKSNNNEQEPHTMSATVEVPSNEDPIDDMEEHGHSSSDSSIGTGSKNPWIEDKTSENVELRETELRKSLVTSIVPTWANTKLRETAYGRELLEKQRQESLRRLFVESEDDFTKKAQQPEWSKLKLRPTPTSFFVKQECLERQEQHERERRRLLRRSRSVAV